MSASSFYPLSLIAKLAIEKLDRTIADSFDDGSTSARSVWPAQYFKRRYTLTHAPLTLNEWRYLRSFHSQRSGRYDTFWFRDNVHREGNVLSRFATPLQASFIGSARNVQLMLEEVAALRALPEFDEITAAAGAAPFLWWDANRETYYKHLANTYTDPIAWDEMGNYRAAWQGGTVLQLGGAFSQFQSYANTGGWAKTAANVAELSTTQPAFTVFAIVQHSASANSHILFSIGPAGGVSSRQCLGLQLVNGVYAPFIGDVAFAWGLAANNSPVDTWRSLAATFPAATNSATPYVNAATAGAIAVTRNYTAGPASLGADSGGNFITNASGAMNNANIAHILCFAATLSAAQIKAVHNLLAYQYGLAVVP